MGLSNFSALKSWDILYTGLSYLNKGLYQGKADVDMLSTVKNYLADVSSISPYFEGLHVQFQ